MTEEWRVSTLHTVADVRVSNVDKKFYATETPVKLCNYMDVYANDYVTGAIEFMAASASKAEIERFGLMAGDVVITKDSETPDDIGVPAVIAEQISRLVCGYHLALIRPRQGEIDPIYLAKQLRAWPSIKYFAANASGSTRFGLSISAIENLEIPLAPRPEQTKIAEILSTVDRAIAQTEALISKQQRIKAGLMQDLLTRGIDEHGNLRSEQTHQFKDSPLGRIPREWKVTRIDTIAKVTYGISDAIDVMNTTGVPTITLPCVASNGQLDVNPSKLAFTDPKAVKDRDLLRKGDLLFNWRNGSQDHLGKTAYFDVDGLYTHVGFLLRIRVYPELCDSRFLWFLINDIKAKGYFFNAKIQVNNTFNSNELNSVSLAIPTIPEQCAIRDHLASIENATAGTLRQLAKLHALKTGLMQDLLTGKRRVTALLSETEARA